MKYIKSKLSSFVLPVIVILSLLFSSCDKNFEEINKDPNAYTTPVINSLFSSAINVHHQGQITDPELSEAGAWVQYLASLQLAEFYGDKYLWREGYYERFWNKAYSTELRETTQILALTKNKPDMLNHYNIARIWRVEVLHRVTDMYGDCPYFEAGKGYTDRIFNPKYDPQADIYADMLKELEEAAQALNPGKPSYGNADFLYMGNTEKWKKFAYSLMLRLGMRLTKVDPTMSEIWVKKAIAGGVMQSNEDVAKLVHTSASSTNWNAMNRIIINEFVSIKAKGKTIVKLNKTFIDFLKRKNDPRIRFYATLWQGNEDISQLSIYSAPDIQKGLPGGNDGTTIKSIVPGWTDEMRATYSEWNCHKIASLEAPSIFQSYSEVEYLLAEAALRGWGPGTPEEHYNKGVIASIQSQRLYPNSESIGNLTTAANDFLAANPFISGSFGNQMEQIHYQFWVSQFMQSNVEAYSNWRRTGYPILTSYDYPGNETGGSIPRRVRYSPTEASINVKNYEDAVQRQGPDLFTTRVWWDKP